MVGRLQDKTVVITGASAGIGAAAARRFAAEGARLVLAARGEEALAAIAAELGALAVPTDVADPAQCARLLERAAAHTGGVHVLVNNAGAHARGPVEQASPEQLAAMLDVNLRGPIVLSRLVLPYLRASGGGAIVQVASLAGRVPLPFAATYSASKFGLRVFSRALAEELEGQPIAVRVVSPGPVATDFILADLDHVSDATLSQPMSTADEVAIEVVEAALGGPHERFLHAGGRWLTTLSYLSPGLSRLLRPVVEWRGRRARERLRGQVTRA